MHACMGLSIFGVETLTSYNVVRKQSCSFQHRLRGCKRDPLVRSQPVLSGYSNMHARLCQHGPKGFGEVPEEEEEGC